MATFPPSFANIRTCGVKPRSRSFFCEKVFGGAGTTIAVIDNFICKRTGERYERKPNCGRKSTIIKSGVGWYTRASERVMSVTLPFMSTCSYSQRHAVRFYIKTNIKIETRSRKSWNIRHWRRTSADKRVRTKKCIIFRNSPVENGMLQSYRVWSQIFLISC